MLDDINILRSDEFSITYEKDVIEQTNWNKEWEKNFNPIQVDGHVSIRAPFHVNPNLQYDIIIEPKMSFGTGHHETTHMMIQHLMDLDLDNKKVLDMGCGTGILAIFAEMKGAKQIDAIDIDSWCYENSIENCERNQCSHINVYEGDASILKNDKGVLLLSGFYKEDILIINAETSKYKLSLQKTIERNNWAALKYVN